MPLKEELQTEVGEIFRNQWSISDGRVVPDESSIGLGNDAIKIEATVLYADISESTKLVDERSAQFAAEVYNAFFTLCRQNYSRRGRNHYRL